MEAKKLKQNKMIGRKGKIKKTIKHVICRPDTVQWPLINDVEKSSLKSVLELYKIRIPEFRKPHWNEIKLIPKSDRPKPPPIKRVNGLLFGISECKNAIQSGQCCSVLIEATVNPQTIVQPVIDKCFSSNIPVLCIENLKKLCKVYFGIKTSCLGVKNDSLSDLCSEIKDIFQQYKLYLPKPNSNKNKNVTLNNETVTHMDVNKDIVETNIIVDPYLFRSNKKTRVFDPSGSQSGKEIKKFSGQNFIKVLDSMDVDVGKETDRKAYMRMILKKISNNPNRVKTKQ